MTYRVVKTTHDVVYSDDGPMQSVFHVRETHVDSLKQANTETNRVGFMEDAEILYVCPMTGHSEPTHMEKAASRRAQIWGRRDLFAGMTREEKAAAVERLVWSN